MEPVIENIILKLRKEPSINRNIAHVELLPERGAIYAEIKKELPDKITDYLEINNIRLYKHQCDSLDAIRERKQYNNNNTDSLRKNTCIQSPNF